MKFKLNIILLILMLFLSSSLNVDAAANFDGIGTPSGSAGGGGGGSCTGGYCLKLAPVLKFNLVDITGDNLNVISYYSMVNPNGTYDDNFRSKNVNGNAGIVGHIYGSYYNAGAFKIDEFPSEYTFSNIKNIVSTARWGYTFDVNALRAAIIDDSASEGITDAYSKIVIYMLKSAGIISSGDTVESLSPEIKANLNRYRIIIEPVYSFGNNAGTSYMFATIKGISSLRKSTRKQYGYDDSMMFYNAAAPTSIKNSSGNVILQYYDDNKWLDNMANVGHGAGYVVVQLSYNTPEVCLIEKDASNNFVFTDTLGGKYANNLDNGSNFGYFISEGQCKCDGINNSSYKDELLNIPIIKSIYDANCTTPKSCEYEKVGSNYKFYDASGNLLSDYKEFADKCGCYSEKVLELKDIFSSVYNDTSVCGSDETNTPNGNFGFCTIDNTVSLTRYKLINPYCERTCVETVEFNNVPDTSNDAYEAGKFFNLSNYPSLISTKNCILDFKYDDWSNNYKSALSNSVSYYNEWQKYSNVSSSTSGCCVPGEYGCITYYYTHTSNYSGFKVNSDGLTLTSQGFTANLGTTCGSKSFSGEASAANASYWSYSTQLESLKTSLSACDNAINFDVVYNPVSSLKFRYQQSILEKDNITLMWNDVNDGTKVDDSEMNEVNRTVTRYCNGTILSSGEYCGYPSEHLFDNISGNSIQQNSTRIKSFDLTRKVIVSNTYEPALDKYIEPLTGNIGTTGAYLGKYYDIDIRAIEKDNNKNEFVFTSIGENPNSNTSLYKLTTQDNLTRACTYKTINNVVDCPTGDCYDGTESTLKYVFRIVDPNKIDPNKRLEDETGEKGFENWKNIKGTKVIEQIQETASNANTYSPDNLEYSFNLNSATLKVIRAYNANCSYGTCDPIKYSDITKSELECNSEGNECKSAFITKANSDSNWDGEDIKKFATNISGRNKWKYLVYNETSNKYKIEIFNEGAISYSDLLSKIELGVEEVLP